MFPAIVHRGRDAWGYMHWSQDDDAIEYFKSAGSCKLTGAQDDMVIDNPTNVRWLVGHVRAATLGSPQNNNNNHPILHHNIVGVHNGVISNHRGIFADVKREYPDALVDSEAIFASVNKHGVHAGLAKVYGDMVSVFSDVRRPGTLRIARTHGRPLVLAHTPAGSLVFASELKVLDSLGIDLKDVQHFSAENQVWTVREGRVTQREQFRAPPTYTYNPVIGKSQSKSKGKSTKAAPSTSSAVVPFSSAQDWSNTGERDRWGGRYLGHNRWMTSDNEVMGPDAYIGWCWEQKMASESAFSHAEVGDHLEQALAIVSNNGNVG